MSDLPSRREFRYTVTCHNCQNLLSLAILSTRLSSLLHRMLYRLFVAAFSYRLRTTAMFSLSCFQIYEFGINVKAHPQTTVSGRVSLG